MAKHRDVVCDIMDYFEAHDDIFTQCLNELDDWDGFLGTCRYYEMDELDSHLEDAIPSHILIASYEGYDEDSFEKSRIEFGAEIMPFNPHKDWFRYTYEGNLVSASKPDYSGFLNGYTIVKLEACREHVDCIKENDELNELFNKLEKAVE